MRNFHFHQFIFLIWFEFHHRCVVSNLTKENNFYFLLHSQIKAIRINFSQFSFIFLYCMRINFFNCKIQKHKDGKDYSLEFKFIFKSFIILSFLLCIKCMCRESLFTFPIQEVYKYIISRARYVQRAIFKFNRVFYHIIVYNSTK